MDSKLKKEILMELTTLRNRLDEKKQHLANLQARSTHDQEEIDRIIEKVTAVPETKEK